MFIEGQKLSDFTERGFQEKENEKETKARRLQDQMKNYEFTTKNLQDSLKILDYFTSLFNQSLENEKVYLKNQQKLINNHFNSSNQMVNFIKFNQQYNDLFLIMQEDIIFNYENMSKKYNLQKQLTEVFSDEVRQIQEKIKKYDHEVKLLDKTTNNAFNKLSKIRDKFLKVAREEEMTFIQLECMDQNKEQQPNQFISSKNKILKNSQNLFNEKEDLDKQMKQFQQSHNQAALFQSHEVKNKNDVLYLDHEKLRQKTGQIFTELTNYNMKQIQDKAKHLQEKQKKIDFIQMSRQNLFKELQENYQSYEDKSQYFINDWKPFSSFLTNSVNYIKYRMDKRQNKPKLNHEKNYEDQSFISKEFKDYLQQYFKIHIDQFGKDLITLKHQYFKIVKQIYEALEDNESNGLNSKNQKNLSKSQQKGKSVKNNENKELVEQKGEKNEDKKEEQNQNQQQQKQNQENSEDLETQISENQEEFESPKHKYVQDEKIEQFEQELEQKEKNLEMFYQAHKKIQTNIKYIVVCLYYYTHPQNQQKMTEFDKYYLQDLIHRQLYRRTLVSGIQAFRNYGIKQFEQTAFQNLFRLFNRCLTVCLQVKDCWAATKLMVMSCTLYTLDNNNNAINSQSSSNNSLNQQTNSNKNNLNQINKYGSSNNYLYVQEVIMNNPIWKSQDLWENMIYDTVIEELDKQFPNASYKKMDQNEYGFQYKQLVQSNLLSVGANMQKFKINKESVKTILTKFAHYFGLFEIQVQEIAKFAEFDPSQGGGSAFLQGPSSLTVMNNYYSNQSQLKSKDNDNTLVNIINDSLKKGENVQTEQVQNQSQFKSKIFTFGGSKTKD